MKTEFLLASLGWRAFFEAQLHSDQSGVPARVTQVHRSSVELQGERGPSIVELGHGSASLGLTVGDWVMVDPTLSVIHSRLEPFALFRRGAAGSKGATQSIAANVDTVFIVTSANRDFNVARLERYLAIAHDAGSYPLIVITKADLAADTNEYVAAASRLSAGLLVEALDARDREQVAVLRSWCAAGQTVALLGSSGVGKSTLINTLAGSRQTTLAVREDDQHGRHTTTGRSMHRLLDGGWLIDTPGMRELSLPGVGSALDDVFSDIAALAASCRFADCTHDTEPYCSVQAAIGSGTLDPERLRRYRKLQSEDRRNAETLAERRSRDRSQGKLYKSILSGKRKGKGMGC